MESKYLALTKAIKEVKWVRTLLAELGYLNNKPNQPTDLFSDSQSTIALAKNPISYVCAKYIDFCHHFNYEAI
jgi:hypothetical protein